VTQAYATLEKRFRRLSGLSGAAEMLGWDQAVMMPRGANQVRGQQLAVLASVQHEIMTSDEIEVLLADAEQEPLDGIRAASLREMRREIRHARALPADLVEALSLATNACEMEWRSAREHSDFQRLRPKLEEVVRLTRESAVLKGEALGLAPYDALMDQFQPGLSLDLTEPLFATLAEALPNLVDEAVGRQAAPIYPRGPFPIEEQRKLARSLMAQIGFDFERGRLDESTHPFCGGVPGDVRITTRYNEREIVSALMGVLHETGHALYEIGLPERHRHLPVGQSRGIAIHESQSLIMEMQACRSPAFLRFLAARLGDSFGADRAFSEQNLVRLYTQVQRGLIRVDADELTYPLHIALRFELERALIDDDLRVAELPSAWNEAMQCYLGIVPPDDRHGVLQDIHWPVGAIGYFPNYTLGALLAAQLFRALQRDIPEISEAIAVGDFSAMVAWLHEHIHKHACELEFAELIIQATGKPLGCQDFLDHARSRYLN